MAEARWLTRASHDRRLRMGLVILGVLALGALLAPWISPYDPAGQPDPVGLKLRAPSFAHPLGTDPFSRDVLSRLLAGSSVSLGIDSVRPPSRCCSARRGVRSPDGVAGGSTA